MVFSVTCSFDFLFTILTNFAPKVWSEVSSLNQRRHNDRIEASVYNHIIWVLKVVKTHLRSRIRSKWRLIWLSRRLPSMDYVNE